MGRRISGSSNKGPYEKYDGILHIHKMHRRFSLRGCRNKNTSFRKDFVNNIIKLSTQHMKAVRNRNLRWVKSNRHVFSTGATTRINLESKWGKLATQALIGNKKSSSRCQGGVLLQSVQLVRDSVSRCRKDALPPPPRAC
jgi:hypothetical protein